LPPAGDEVPAVAPISEALHEHIDWLIRLRWLAVVGTLGAIVLADRRLPGVLPIVPLVAVVGFIALYNLIFYLYSAELRYFRGPGAKLRASPLFAHVQILLDLTSLTILLHYSGGVENPFAMYYVFHVVIASILLPPVASFAYAGLATLLYGGVALLEYAGLIPHVNLVGLVGPDRYRQETYLIAALFALGTTLFFAVALASTIASRLRRREQQLLEAGIAAARRAEEMAELNAKLRELDDFRNRFTMIVTHELRAPVAAIQSYIKLILEGFVPPEREQEILERAERRAWEQLSLISDLLELSKVKEKALEKAPPLDLGDVLRSVVELMRAPAQEKDLLFSVEMAPDLPKVALPAEQAKQVWTNLISNAIKYTPPGGIVVVSLTQNPNYVVGTVRDTGIGIAPKDREHIFEEFFRAQEAKALEAHGTGLGLSLVKRILESYGGHIWVESEVGKGSTFTFVLPKVGT
jgi:signal transduction histidine kinase